METQRFLLLVDFKVMEKLFKQESNITNNLLEKKYHLLLTLDLGLNTLLPVSNKFGKLIQMFHFSVQHQELSIQWPLLVWSKLTKSTTIMAKNQKVWSIQQLHQLWVEWWTSSVKERAFHYSTLWEGRNKLRFYKKREQNTLLTRVSRNGLINSRS